MRRQSIHNLGIVVLTLVMGFFVSTARAVESSQGHAEPAASSEAAAPGELFLTAPDGRATQYDFSACMLHVL